MDPNPPAEIPTAAPAKRRRSSTVARWMFNIVTVACMCAALKYWRIISIGPDGGPSRTMTFVEFFSDSIRFDGQSRILFFNNNPHVLRSVTFGTKGEYGRFGPLARGRRCECVVPNPPLGTTIPITYVEATPTGDVVGTYPITTWNGMASRGYTFNPDRSMMIESGPFPASR